MVPMHCLIMPAAYAEGANENDVWHLDEVVVRINGQKSWVWRAVDQDGYVLDEIVQRAQRCEVGSFGRDRRYFRCTAPELKPLTVKS